MNFESVNNELAALGCKQSHIDAFWRNWYLGRPLTQAKFTFPKAAAEAAATSAASERRSLHFNAGRLRGRLPLLYDRALRSRSSAFRY